VAVTVEVSEVAAEALREEEIAAPLVAVAALLEAEEAAAGE
jgi:hypothetical protein